MKKILSFIFLLSVIAIPFSLTGQITSLTDAQSLDEGAYTFNFGNGNFQGYIDEDGWILWMQYHHEGGTNPNLNVIQLGNDLPIFDDSPLGTDLETLVSGDMEHRILLQVSQIMNYGLDGKQKLHIIPEKFILKVLFLGDFNPIQEIHLPQK